MSTGPAEEEPALRRPRPSWARLLHKILEVDPRERLCSQVTPNLPALAAVVQPIDKRAVGDRWT